MKKYLTSIVLGLMIVLGGCTVVDTETEHESVIMDRPIIFGTGGVRSETFKPGRQFTWFTSAAEAIDMRPYAVTEVFDDLTTSEGSYVDFTTALTLKIIDPIGRYRLGDKWYEHNLQRPYQEIVRRAVRIYSMPQLRTDVAAQIAIEADVRKQLETLITSLNLPVKLIDVSLGKATPNKDVQAQIDQTTAQQQRKLTMDEFRKAEDARREAEKARGDADNAYRNQMGLTGEQFVRLEQTKRFSEACIKAANCTLLNGVSEPIVVGK